MLQFSPVVWREITSSNLLGLQIALQKETQSTLIMRGEVNEQNLVVLVTVASADTGVQLGRQLVEEELAACVQVLGNGTAIYRWQGQLYVDPQTQLLIKTTGAAWDRLVARIVELHEDEVPEILALPVVAGLPAYLDWLGESVRGPGGS